MKSFWSRIAIALLFITATFSAKAEFGQWCVADSQIPDYVTQAALDWACQHDEADCFKIQPNQPCFLPNTVKDHASVVFNSYYQRYKHMGADCYFSSAAILTQRDPSYGSCHFEFMK
ncbi:PREDICTED: glucan endo-1,3-beta-glucosidase 12-like isoform X2 [Camelina sativa]|uniref:Glucan endo-1,3-beta-glucosidase 12-like isoform X2 n=1 Tax=Camelina sativa TaxID=90675 RepID=A0ABM0W836_CAMSA|nr:PREDICTED: glucan endo-1,3-beta-glucosidase 12-like isoform X2 [Camelina sativa]